MIVPILIATIVGGTVLLLVLSHSGRSEKKANAEQRKPKTQRQIIKECSKRLQHDPHNVPALTLLADTYYKEKNFEQALPLYKELYNLFALNSHIDKKHVTLRLGICEYKSEHYEEALNVFTLVHQQVPDEFEINYYLGCTLYKLGDYEHAVPSLKKALIINPEAAEVQEPLGYSYYKAKKFKEALPLLRKILDEQPDNKEALFAMARSMSEVGMSDKSLKIFMHLRPDPAFGAEASLAAGNIHLKTLQYDDAIQDFTIGLKHSEADPEVTVQLLYNLGTTYLTINNIPKALSYLTQVQNLSPNYKDTTVLIQRYQELNQNSNLQIYLLAGSSEFVALCRAIVMNFYKQSKVRIEDIAVTQHGVDVLCYVVAPKWEDTELFRFFRTTGSTGELFIRDFHSKLKDTKSDRGFCITAGTFSDEAKKFGDGRPIDFIEKNKLIGILKKVTF